MMPNHPPKTLSYKDARFIEETLGHCKDFIWPNYTRSAAMLADMNRCIKILESEDE